MPERGRDWLDQTERDLEHARLSADADPHEWACFAAQQAAQKAVKAVYQRLGAETRGHSGAALLRGLRERLEIGDQLRDCGRDLDRFYVPARYPNGWPERRRNSTSTWGIPGVPSTVEKRSYGSVTVYWLNTDEAIRRLRAAADRVIAARPEVVEIHLFGSLAEGRAVPGSDADVLVLLDRSDRRWLDRPLDYSDEFAEIGLGVELFCYTLDELQRVPLARDARAGGIVLAAR